MSGVSLGIGVSLGNLVTYETNDFTRRIGFSSDSLIGIHESIGTKLRKISEGCRAANPLNQSTNPNLAPEIPWVALQAYLVGQSIVSSANIFVCSVIGTSGAVAPAGFASPSYTTEITDGTAKWLYVRPTKVTSADYDAPTPSGNDYVQTNNGASLPAATGLRFTPYNDQPTATPINLQYTPIGGLFSRFVGANVFGSMCAGPSNGNGYPTPNPYGADCIGSSFSGIGYHTDALTSGIGVYSPSGFNFFRLLVDDRYVSYGSACAATASSQVCNAWVTFTTRKRRKLQWSFSASGINQIFADTQATFWPFNRNQFVRAQFMGDSYTGTWDSQGGSLCELIARGLGWEDAWVDSYAGTGFCAGASYAYPQRMLTTARLCPDPDIIVLIGSNNDGGFSNGALSSAVVSCITTYRTYHPTTPIVIFGNPGGAYGNALQAAINAGLLAGVAAAADQNTYFISQVADTLGPWMTGTGHIGSTTGIGNSDFYIRPDAVHPSPLGMAYMADRMVQKIRDFVLPMIA